MGRPTAADEIPLQTQIKIKPFEKWILDFVGPSLAYEPDSTIVPSSSSSSSNFLDRFPTPVSDDDSEDENPPPPDHVPPNASSMVPFNM